ncbi:shikimate dehydrogenase [Alteribacillus bidgolensis]|uniref:Shikimate dehydrogenase (NADP(+)) n=1 Tax=Alteribacillus bidgolensis TaxID=930129 RepID=A0A1G8NWT3_9BACI|nr:shikimate dehydrogenase [Alteribacillus bidgolensis]SDI84751.1 shikimate dehydrogenase [Alteribacillus bidgolensis]
MGNNVLKAEKLFGLLGHPVGHSMSPAMHNDQFEKQGLPYFYHAFDVDPRDLKEAVEGMRALGISGFNVTVPHKVEIMSYLDEIDEEAQIIGAVNTVVNKKGRWIGYNTDGKGYVQSLLTKTGKGLHDYNILVIGAGGASRAVVTSLYKYGVQSLAITNRTISKAENIRKNLGHEIEILEKEKAEIKTGEYDLIINTTSMGMSPHVNTIPWKTDVLKQGCLCSDLIYNPLKTTWLKEAEGQGADTLNGVGMFVGQGAVAFELWTGIWPDIERMSEVVLEQLRRK